MVRADLVPNLADADGVLSALGEAGLARARVLVPNMTGYRRAVQAGARNVLVNVGVTDEFNRKNLNRSVDETLAEIRGVCEAARRDGVRVDGSVSVSFGCPYAGEVSPERTVDLAERLAALGAVEIAFGDTIGVATPARVREISRRATERLPGVTLTMHFHDTRGMALANALAALECGIRSFEGSIGGIGGCPFAPNSTGNVCSEDLLALVESEGYETGVDVDALIGAARTLGESLGRELPGRLQRAGRAPWMRAVRA
jgi:hydroxymethylglutaryl-CoA lyase